MFSLICFKPHNLFLFVFKRNDKVLQVKLKNSLHFLFHSLHFTLSSFSRHYHKLLYILLFHFWGYLHIHKCKSMNILFSNFLVIIVILQLAFSLNLFVFFLLKKKNLFGCTRSQLACEIFIVTTCGIQFPDQGSNLGPQCWEHRVLVTGPRGKSQPVCLSM